MTKYVNNIAKNFHHYEDIVENYKTKHELSY